MIAPAFGIVFENIGKKKKQKHRKMFANKSELVYYSKTVQWIPYKKDDRPKITERRL